MTIDALLVELTTECDRSCAHCYNQGERGRAPALAWSELRPVVLRSLDELGCRTVTLIGGEPLLVPSLLDVIEELSERVRVAMSTHGGELGDAAAEGLARAGLRAVEISLCADVGDGTWLPNACRALAAASGAGLACTASAVLARPFLRRLQEMAEVALAFGASGLVLQPLVLPRRGGIAPELIPSDDEWIAAAQRLREWSIATAFPVVVSNLVGEDRVPEHLRAMMSPPCSCQTSKRVIDAWGRIRRCEAHPGMRGPTRRAGGDCPRLAHHGSCARSVDR